MNTFLKYLGAFIVGFVGSAILPPLLKGMYPTQADLLPGIAMGLIGTGLFHQIPPRADDTKPN